VVLGKIGRDAPGAGCDGPIAKIARDLRLRSAEGSLVTLIDFKAGFEDSARGVVTGLDWIVVVVDPTTAAVTMAVDMVGIVGKLAAGAAPATSHLESAALVEIARRIYRDARVRGFSCVLNRIRDEETEATLRAVLERSGIEPLGSIHDEPSITRAWLAGDRLGERKIDGEVRAVARRLEQAVSGSLDRIAHEP
jgi:CO dehydrogenase nickel-insertion accessory protein CooC1